MDNQHKKITGYRELSQEEIDLMNKGKALAAEVGRFIDELAAQDGIDARWLEVGKTNLQQGFMATTRAIAQPTSF